MLLKILILFSIISLKIPQKCEVKQFLSMQPWIRQHQHKFRKKLRSWSPISYSNTSATQRILLGWDIETNPGLLGWDIETKRGSASATNLGSTPTNDEQNNKNATTAKRKSPIGSVCEKTVRINSKWMICTYCKLQAHLHNTNTKSLIILNQKNAKEWTSFSCVSIELPFHKLRDQLNTSIEKNANYTNEHLQKLDELKKQIRICHLDTQAMSSTFDEKNANYTNEHLQKLDELKKQISICHLDTQSMSSTFDEFQCMINQTNVDVIALSQTWLKNDKHLEYIRLPGYELAYQNRDEKRGWGVGIYIRDTLEFKVSDDVEFRWINWTFNRLRFKRERKIVHVLSVYCTNQVLKITRNIDG